MRRAQKPSFVSGFEQRKRLGQLASIPPISISKSFASETKSWQKIFFAPLGPISMRQI